MHEKGTTRSGVGSGVAPVIPHGWSPESWRAMPSPHLPAYEDASAVDAAVAKLRRFPPLVTSGEVEHLRSHIAEAQEGKRFVLQGGDCAESLADCTPEVITSQLKILLQMSLVLVHGMKKPVVRMGRIAGQYAKPRSSATETRDGETHPSYYGDLVNRPEFTAEARRPNPHLLVRGYQHAGVTLNFIRSLIDGGFADLHHPEHWDLRFMRHANLAEELSREYTQMAAQLSEALKFMEALGEKSFGDTHRVDFFTSHEALNLLYESAQTRTVPRRSGHYNLTTHFPWIGERTRGLDGPHVEYARGIRNPMGIKVGPKMPPKDVVPLIDRLNPGNEAGRITLIHRMGAERVEAHLPALLEVVRDAGRKVLWVCDPMHGNTRSAAGGVKTRSFEAILRELNASFDLHEQAGTILGGVHFELTGDDVTECVGGATGLSEADLGNNYLSACDPRLNYSQALEMAFLIARRMGG